MTSTDLRVYSSTARTTTGPPHQAQDAAIRPFVVDVPQADLDDLRERVKATRWPGRELVADALMGTMPDTRIHGRPHDVFRWISPKFRHYLANHRAAFSRAGGSGSL